MWYSVRPQGASHCAPPEAGGSGRHGPCEARHAHTSRVGAGARRWSWRRDPAGHLRLPACSQSGVPACDGPLVIGPFEQRPDISCSGCLLDSLGQSTIGSGHHRVSVFRQREAHAIVDGVSQGHGDQRGSGGQLTALDQRGERPGNHLRDPRAVRGIELASAPLRPGAVQGLHDDEVRGDEPLVARQNRARLRRVLALP